MKYRRFKKLGLDISALGFGAMRLPIYDGEAKNINKELTSEIMSYAFDNGVNYVDTAYPYHEGNSEIIVGDILKNGYRDKVHLATKSPTWAIEKTEDFDKYLDEQLNKLQVNHIDFYLLHNLHSKVWNKIRWMENRLVRRNRRRFCLTNIKWTKPKKRQTKSCR